MMNSFLVVFAITRSLYRLSNMLGFGHDSERRILKINIAPTKICIFSKS